MHNNSEKRGGALSGLYKKIDSNLKSVKSLFNNAIAVILENNGQGQYFYGESDRLPNEIIEYINNSGTASACIERLDQFTQADGFNSPLLANKKINLTQNWNQLLADVSMNTSYMQGFALRLFYTNAGKIGRIECHPVQTFRKYKDGSFCYNELMGEWGKNESENLRMLPYVPMLPLDSRMGLIKQQKNKYGKQVGEIMYVYKKRIGRLYSIYPVPNYYSGIADIIADGKLSEFELRNISQGWRASVIISTGPVDNINQDDEGKTEQDYYDEALSEFVGEDAAPILHLKGKTNEDKPTVTTLNLADLVDATDKSSVRIPNRVCRLMTVPPVLIGIASPGQLGNVQELQNSMKLFQLTVLSRQNMISEAFKSLIPDLPEEYANEDFSISQLNVFDEIKKSLDGQEQSINQSLASMSGKQQMQFLRIIRDYNKGKMTENAALIMLQSSFGFSQETAKSLLNDGEELNTNTDATIVS